MPQYKKKPTLVEATQWFRNGDHPYDESVKVDTTGPGTTLTEGKVVKFFRRLHIPGDRVCQECGNVMHKHGLIDGLNGEEETVHPGDYILTHAQGHFYRRSAKDFEAMFEPYTPGQEDLGSRVRALEERFVSDPERSQVVPFEKIGRNLAEPITPDPGKVQ